MMTNYETVEFIAMINVWLTNVQISRKSVFTDALTKELKEHLGYLYGFLFLYWKVLSSKNFPIFS